MASDYTSKFSEKYGQLSGADLEILGAREQAATARALRTAFKPTQGQMVGGWYVKPALTQHLADALMQYNNYKNEQAGTAKAQELIDARKLATKTNALAQAKLSTDEAQPAYDREVTPARQDVIPAVESGTTNSLVDEALAAGYGTNEQGQPLFDAAHTPSAAPIDRSQALLDKSIQMQAQAKADADAATPLTSILNQYFPELSKATLGNAVRTAPLDNVGASINNQTPIPAEGTSQASQVTPAPQEQTLPTITTPAPMEAPAQPNRLAQMLRGEGDYAPIQKASVRDIPAVTERMPAVKGYNEGEWLKQQQALIANDQFHAADAVGAYIKERKVAETAKSVAQMADLKVQREGILNREQARAIATERIEDNAIRERQRAADKKEAAASLQAFTKAEHALNRTLTSEESKNRREDRREANANKAPTGVLARELNDADEATFQSGLVLKQLQAALDLNDKAYSGFGALTRAEAAGKITGMVGGKPNAEADATISLNNIITTQALESLKLTFGAAPTEGERKILLEIQGSVDKTPAQRKDIFERAMTMAKAKQGFHSRKAEAIRSGTWSKQNYNPSEPEAAATPPVYIFNKATNETMVSTDGQKTWKKVN